MQTKDQKKPVSTVKKGKTSASLKAKKDFLLLSGTEKHKLLKRQAEKLYSYYAEDENWREFQALDIKDD
jgi:hypothetical protein